MDKVISAFLVILVEVFLGGLIFMFAVMFIHEDWLTSVPTIGYWHAVVVSAFIRASLTTYNSYRK